MLERNGRKELRAIDYEHRGRTPNLTDAPIRSATASGQGYAGGDLRFTGLTSVKGTRVRDSTNPAPVNVKTAVGLCTGFASGSDTLESLPAHNPMGPQNRRARAKLRKALKSAR